MARIDDLVTLIQDDALRRELQQAVGDLKRRQRFGIVFEQHIPETTTVARFPLRPGMLVQRRDDPAGKFLYRVLAVDDDGVVASPRDSPDRCECFRADDLLAVRRFGEPVFPGLTSVGVVRRGGTRPHHAVINGENYHALQLLASFLEEQVDVIYIDPPYNTGDKDWKYNNNFVDKKDAWRHSKWLSFMEKRLRIAKRLLRHNGF